MKTVKEAAKEYGRKVSPQSDWTARNAEISFKSGVEYAQRWIAIEEDKPEKSYLQFSEEVICKFTFKTNPQKQYHEIGQYNHEKKWFEDSNGEIIERVTHWRPIDRK